jgi:PAS domain S-box-containing protein
MNNASNRRLRAKLKEVRQLVPVFPRWVRRLGYYGLALLFVAAAAMLRSALWDVLSPAPTLVFYLAWVGAAAFGGLGPGLLATVASWLCIDLLFDPTPGQINFADPASIARLLVLLAGGLAVSLIGEKMRRGRIHERRQGRELAGANAVFRESEERLWQRAEEVETLMDLIPAAIWVAHDPQCNHITGNQAANRLYEAYEQENVSANVSPVRRFFRDGQELKPEELPMQAAAKNIDIRDSEADVLLPSGKWRNMLGSASPLHDAEGRVRGCIGAFVDITAHKQAEQALRERMKELACLYAVSRDMQEELSLDELCRRAVKHLVPAMQFPESAVPVIELKGKRFTSENYGEGLSQGLQAEIRVEGEVLGHLRVYYAQERPFVIPEEQNLVNGIAEAFGTWLERKRAEEALRESEEKYRYIVETATEGIVMVDANARVVFANGRWSEIFGYSLDEARHMTHFDMVFPEDRAQMRERWESRKRGVKENYEFRFRRKDGRPVWTLIGAAPRLDPEGRFLGTLVMVTDITKRKQAEEALRRSERRFKSTFENAAIGIAHVALDGRILQFNSRFCEIAGYSCADVLGKTCEQITFADDWEAERAQIQRLLDGEVAHYSIEKRYLRADGSPVWVNLTRSIQRDEAGKAEYFIVLVEDISERKHAEEALRDLTAMLESKVAQRTTELKHCARQLQKLALDMSETEDRERQRLAEILHDDLQQVLAAAKFHVGLMRNRAKSNVSLQATAAQVDHMLKEAIDKSRSLSHELSPAVMHHGDFAETLRWLAGDMQTKHGFLVHVQAHGQTHPQSDAIKSFLYKTAQELLFNAIKHAGVNEARIRVRQCRRCVCLSVSDRGRGFDPQELPHAAGFGLLSIRERIELLGGRMKIKSAKGKGSRFFIALPQNETAEAGSEVEARSNGRAKGTGRAAGDDSGRLRVLLADDHEIVRQGLASLLSEEDTIEIVGEAANGREAVDLAQKLEPDVVVMDVAMPIMGGDEAARQIKQDLPQTRIISLSMFEDPELREKMYQAGAENYVLKTAPSRELLAAIRGKEPNLEEESRAIEIR